MYLPPTHYIHLCIYQLSINPSSCLSIHPSTYPLIKRSPGWILLSFNPSINQSNSPTLIRPTFPISLKQNALSPQDEYDVLRVRSSCQPIHPSINHSIYLSIMLSIHLSCYLSIHLSIYLSYSHQTYLPDTSQRECFEPSGWVRCSQGWVLLSANSSIHQSFN